MTWDFSRFGDQLGRGSGIGDLMDDLGHALAAGGEQVLMLGGGQPAHLPEVDALWRQRWQSMQAEAGKLEAVVGNYEPPLGGTAFRDSIAGLLRRQYGWNVSRENIAVTAGGQTALFLVFNALAGEFRDGRHKQILLPLVPEYIGYANQSVAGSMFRSVRPQIELIGDHQFKYRVDFESIEIDSNVGAICVSRPTNPTGNVLTDQEIDHLHRLAVETQIPLLVDQAYGAPFPDVIFKEIKPRWDEQMILTLSLSKLGLPGTRTAAVVACPEMVRAIGSMNSIVGLANSNLGQAIVQPLIDNGEVSRVCREVIRPFYLEKSQLAQSCIRESFGESVPYRVHVSEGAFFLWVWFEGLPIHSQELYERLKRRGVLVVPGHHFFFGLSSDQNENEGWKHAGECIRISFSMPDEVIKKGIQLIAEEIRSAYDETC
ncbi:valine--pyruvate transaminase [Rhodopirellula sp.]|nr:valine--pyruvate transaminase [Rhodopirellula sp.]